MAGEPEQDDAKSDDAQRASEETDTSAPAAPADASARAEPRDASAPAEPAPAEPARSTLSTSAAILCAWALLAAINAAFIARLPKAAGHVRLIHHLYDAGQLLSVGALLSLVVALWRWKGPKAKKGRIAAAIAITAVSAALAILFARIDLSGLAEDLGGDASGGPMLYGLLALLAVTPAAAAWVGGWLARPRIRWAAVAVALAVAVLNDVLLQADYRGLHLFLAIDATTFFATALSGVVLPSLLGRFAAWRPSQLVAPLVFVATMPAMVIRPSNVLRQELAKIDGAVVLPALARYAWAHKRAKVAVPDAMAEWFEDRSSLPPVPPTKPPVVPADPIVILIGVDSMRADLFTKPDSLAKVPHIAAIRDRSLDFTLARSPASRTISTWGSVFTGKYYTGIRWKGDSNRPSISPDPTVRFPELLTKSGVKTVNFVSYSALDKNNVGRNFSETTVVRPRKGQQFGLSVDVMPKLIDRVIHHSGGPLFVFAHLMDPHYPYDSVLNKGSGRARFLAEIGQADDSIGALWSALDDNHLLDRTVLIITADHGEGFGQHGARYHTVNLYEELIRVPLFVYVPGAAPRKIETPVSLMDLGPTILDLFGQPTPTYFLGESLVPFAQGKNPTLTRPIAAERYGTHVMVLGSRKIILDTDHGREEIYDLDRDPNENDNLADDLGAEGAAQVELVRAFFDAHALGADL